MAQKNIDTYHSGTSPDQTIGSIAHDANRVLRNTYMLLGLTIAFSAVCASIGMNLGMPYLGLWTLLPFFGLLWGIHKAQNSIWGLVLTFALTGWLGLTLAPLLNYYLTSIGPAPILLALGGTATIFFSLSAYVLITQKDLSAWGNFLFIGIMVAFVAGLASYFFELSSLALAVSSMFVLLSAGMIMYQTSLIIHGGERNYVLATVTLYVMIYNLFTSLLHLLGAFTGED